MSGPGRHFDPSELDDLDGAPIADADAAGLLRVARELESFARAEAVVSTTSFEDRIMAAVAAEAPPRPVATGRSIAAFAAAVRDAWRITFSGGRPLVVRAQAFALVLLVLVAVGSAGTLAAVGVSQILREDPTAPPTVPSLEPSVAIPTPTVGPSSMEPSTTPSPSPSPSPSAEDSAEPGESAEPSDDPGATDDHGGGTATQPPTATPRTTIRPSDIPRPSDTPEPSETPHPSDTPEPSDTPKPSDTPEPTGTSSGEGSGGTDDA